MCARVCVYVFSTQKSIFNIFYYYYFFAFLYVLFGLFVCVFFFLCGCVWFVGVCGLRVYVCVRVCVRV